MPNKRVGVEYPAKSGIIITPKTNPSGTKAYRVDIPASLTGSNREQRQFPTKEDAQEYASKRHLEIAKFGHAAFSLDAWQRQDAVRALQILARFNLSLESAAMLAAANSKVAQEPVTISELRTRFLASPGRKKTKLIQRRSLTIHNLTWRTARFAKQYGAASAATIQTSHIASWFEKLGPMSAVSLNNYRRALHAMFAFAVDGGFCVVNPVSKIPLYETPPKAPSILAVEEAKRLVECAAETDADLGLLPYIVLGLFAGLRRSELQQLEWSAINGPRKMVTVDGRIAKNGHIRNVTLTDNALVWLKSTDRANEGKIAPLNLNFRLRRLKRLAGVGTWRRNELRHSFASYHYDLHQNAALTAAQLGHMSGSQVLFAHYRSLVPLGDGAKFFDIAPSSPSVIQ